MFTHFQLSASVTCTFFFFLRFLFFSLYFPWRLESDVSVVRCDDTRTSVLAVFIYSTTSTYISSDIKFWGKWSSKPSIRAECPEYLSEHLTFKRENIQK